MAEGAKGKAAAHAATASAESKLGKTSFVAEPGKPTIVITRVFNAPRNVVFEAWTTPEHLQRWMLGPRGWTMPVCENDFRVGGKWRRVWRHENGDEMEMRGEHREIVPPEKVVSTESWGDDWPETVNTLLLSEAGGKTTMALTMQFPSIEARDGALKSGMKEGMEETFNRLETLLERGFRVAPDLLITRVFDAPRERVFAAWSSAEEVKRWFGPKYFTVTNCVVEFRPGGAFRFVLRGPDGKDYPFDGEYIEIREPERIVFKGTIHDEIRHEVLTAVTFTDHDGKTRLSVHQSYNFESDATRGAAEGWGQTLDHLTEYLAQA